MKNKLIFILWLLMFSFFSCDFGIKENEETNSKEYFTVKGSCSIQGAIPSDLLPEKSIKQNAQRTVVPNIETDVITVIFESETKETKTAEVVNNDGVLNFEVELPAGKWTVKAQGKKSDVVIIKSESCQIELSAENKSENVALVLKPTQSDTGEGTFEFSFGQINTKVYGMKYTYKKNGSTESQSVIIDNFSAPKNIELSSGVYTFRFDFYSDMDCTDELLYSFTEVVNIFDGLTTDTWISAGEYINGGKICITNDMINQFVSTTVYVSEFGDDSNLGTFFAPVTTIQKAVDKVIAMNVDTASSEGNPYKILLLGNIETLSDDSFENNNALVNIDPSSASSNDNPLYLTISNYGDEKATINANRSSSNTGRVMYIGKNANVTLQNLILTGGYLKNDINENENGAGLYILNNDANVKIENSEITENVIENGNGAGLYVKNYPVGKSLNLTIENSKISSNTINHNDAVKEYAGAGIAIGNVGANITITDSEINSNKINQDGIANTEDKGVGLWLGNSAVTTISDSTISGNIIENAASTNKNAGGGICIDGGTLTINGDTIISGNLSGYGGGVCIFGGNFTMNNGAEISNCTGDYAGGIIIYTGGTFTMNDGATISTCTSLQYGGGVVVYDSADGTSGAGGTFTMSGGTISGCTAENGCGGGVYVEKGTFTMNGGAVITSNNDVYLTEDQKITITEKLSTNNVTTITPQSYAENKKVLDAGDGIKLSEQQVGMFNVTQSDEFRTEITDEGCLKNTLNNAANLNADLYEICSTIIVKSADEMKAISNLSQTENEGKDFAGKTIILEEAFELDNTYKLIKTFSGVFDGNSKTIKLNKPSEYGYDSNEYFGGAIFNVITGKDAKVSDLTVEGTAYIAGIAIELKNDAVISNCTNNATITSPSVYGAAVPGCGGIVGELSNGGFIENCKNEGTITYNSTNDKGCGGIVGVISSSNIDKGNSIIANCINNGEIKRVQKEGNVEDDVSIGGICGEVTGNAAIYNCVNKGSVTSELTDTSVTENIGGITGYCSVSFYEGEFPSLPAYSIPDDMGIFNCYNSGKISSSYDSNLKYIGGIVGKGHVGFANSVYYTIRVKNTVNNDDATFAFGNINISNNSVEFDITNNFYINASTDTKYPLYEKTFYDDIVSVVDTLNEYSINSNGKYLQWQKGNANGNIIFSEEIIGNQEITP